MDRIRAIGIKHYCCIPARQKTLLATLNVLELSVEISFMNNLGLAMTATYDVRLVILSFGIAILAPYTALDLAGRVTVAQGRERQLWLMGGAIAMGVGIWSMHFVAMLAYNLPIPTTYHFLTVLVSMVVAVVASGVALFVVSRQTMGRLTLLGGGVFMGLSIAAMHYTGMAAMQLAAVPWYDPVWVALSIGIAVSASLTALWLAFQLRDKPTLYPACRIPRGRGSVLKFGGAIAMGLAITGMHYTGMAAVHFLPELESGNPPSLNRTNGLPPLTLPQTIDNSLLAVGIGTATLVILILALMTSLFSQRIRVETARAEALSQSEERFRSLVQNSSDIIAVVAADGTLTYTSQSVRRILGYVPSHWQQAFEFVHSEDLAKAERLLAESLRCPDVTPTTELRLQHGDRSWRDFEVVVNNLLAEPGVNGIVLTYRDITRRKRVEEVLRQQAEREALVAEIAQRIRQTLKLEEILNTTVSEVRQFLQTDRVFIYRFEPDWSGVVTVESVDSAWLAIAGRKIKDTFFEVSANRELYKRGRIQAVEDTHTADLSSCHVDLLTQLQVRANLVVPIRQEERLWGLLVANHCSQPRQWQPLEVTLLRQLETQLAIAIQQSELYQQAQAEIAERKRAEEEVRLLQTLTQAVSEAPHSHAALGVALQEVCKATTWAYGEAWIQQPSGTALEFNSAWCSDNKHLEHFKTVSQALTFPPARGLPGRVWSSKQPEWVQDVSLQPHNFFLRAEIAMEAGLKAGLGVPIIANDQVLAILVFFMFESRQEDQRLVEFASAVATQIGSVIRRKQAEEVLRESEEKFRDLVEQTNDWIWKINEQGIFTYVSPQVREIVGYEPEAILGKTTFDLMAANEVRRFAQVLEHYTSVQKPFTGLEKTVTHKDGCPVVLETNGSPVFDSEGVFQGYRGIARDITARKQAEAEIKKLNQDLQQRAIELEAANQELEAFSYSISHDLRAPLRAMSGFSRILLNEYAPQFVPEAQRYLQIVQDNAQQMGRLIDGLLTFSRLGRASLKQQTIILTDLVHQVLADLQTEQENHHVKIWVDDLPTCQADPLLLKQVWVNLLTNALKFTRQQQAACIDISYQYSDPSGVGSPQCIYFVKDNGAGFDMQYAHKLFGVFQRLHRTDEYEGTGVGLAIAQRIIARHNGRIWAEAGVDQGATFYFTLGGIPDGTDSSGNSLS